MPTSQIDKETLSHMYWDEGLTQREIALRCNVRSKQTIRSWMRKLGISVRSCTDALVLAYHENPDRRLKLANYLRAHQPKHHLPWNKGIPCSDEQKLKISRANKDRPSPMKGKILSAEARERMSLTRKGKPSPKRGIPQCKEQRDKSSKAHMGQLAWNKGIPMREESKRKLQASNQRYWAGLSDEEKENLLKKAFRALRRRPNIPEQRLISQIEKGKLPYRYVGDGAFMLGGKCPDFLNVNGKKQLIELFGLHWHDTFDVARRSEHFRQYGFDTLVIWEDELKDMDAVISKIKKFSHRKLISVGV